MMNKTQRKTIDLIADQLLLKMGNHSSRESQVIDVLLHAINDAGATQKVIDTLVEQELIANPNEPLSAYIVPSASNHRVRFLIAAKNKKDLKDRLKVSPAQAAKATVLPRYDVDAVRVLSATDLVWEKEGTFGEWAVNTRLTSSDA
jgi:hypothetical protein